MARYPSIHHHHRKILAPLLLGLRAILFVDLHPNRGSEMDCERLAVWAQGCRTCEPVIEIGRENTPTVTRNSFAQARQQLTRAYRQPSGLQDHNAFCEQIYSENSGQSSVCGGVLGQRTEHRACEQFSTEEDGFSGVVISGHNNQAEMYGETNAGSRVNVFRLETLAAAVQSVLPRNPRDGDFFPTLILPACYSLHPENIHRILERAPDLAAGYLLGYSLGAPNANNASNASFLAQGLRLRMTERATTEPLIGVLSQFNQLQAAGCAANCQRYPDSAACRSLRSGIPNRPGVAYAFGREIPLEHVTQAGSCPWAREFEQASFLSAHNEFQSPHPSNIPRPLLDSIARVFRLLNQAEFHPSTLTSHASPDYRAIVDVARYSACVDSNDELRRALLALPVLRNQSRSGGPRISRLSQLTRLLP